MACSLRARLGPLFDIAEQVGGELLDLCRAALPTMSCSADAVGVLAAGSGLEPAALFQLTGGNSAKTVDHHVSAVLAKLDAPTRNAAAPRAARLGLAGTAESR
jgi:hypothetical protein